ncbi:MAG: methionine--tRNA ligase [Christensenellaceae bacterium]|nr:methionine--tRNA ligase [Christensenellaceae bacterium]MDD6361021.1 methionine--tRNA ligase [Christensenellaceae bacterium]
MSEKQKYYITTAIAYTSGKPHIGNSYEIVLSDAIARFKRREGYDVFFQTGTDEHGQKIELKAEAAGITPKEYVDKVAGEIKDLYKLLNISYDKFIRTTDEDHERQVQKIFRKMYENGDIYKGSYKGWYCTPCESFWTESQLVDGKCPDCGREVKMAEEEAYFFRMSKYAPALSKYYDEHPDFILPLQRKTEMVNNFIKPGLQDLCVSRTSFKWGIPVDFDDRHVVYVWLDALTNYITGLGYDVDGNSDEKFKKYWPADVHVIGKDIVRFHTIYWPIFLMSLGLPLPKQVFGHPWLLQDGGKMSKSKGNVIYADDLVNFFGVDAVRYFVLAEMPYETDGLVNWEWITDKINNDLANIFGNLVSRTVAMTNKYFGGVLENKGATEEVDKELIAVVTGAYGRVRDKMNEYRISDALGEIFAVFKRANKYIDETMPWALAKDESKADRLKTVLYNLAESIIIGTSLLEPFMPDTAGKVAAYFGTDLRSYDAIDKFGLIADGTKVVEKADILFKRLDVKEVVEQANAMYEARKTKPAEAEEQKPLKPEIDIDLFGRLDLRVAKVIACEKVQKADKLLHLTVDVGGEKRSIVSGIAKYYTAEEMIGKEVVIIANLKPVKLRGIDSQGMILCAEDKDGKLALVSPEKPVESGSEVR